MVTFEPKPEGCGTEDPGRVAHEPHTFRRREAAVDETSPPGKPRREPLKGWRGGTPSVPARQPAETFHHHTLTRVWWEEPFLTDPGRRVKWKTIWQLLLL